MSGVKIKVVKNARQIFEPERESEAPTAGPMVGREAIAVPSAKSDDCFRDAGFLRVLVLTACTPARSRSAFCSSVNVVGDRPPPPSFRGVVEERPGGVGGSGAGRPREAEGSGS
jgi:hypothetical protein